MNQPIPSACPMLLVLLCTASTRAQITFTASELPAAPGDSINEYVTAGTDPSALIGPPGGPQVWDFSYAEQSGDTVRQMAIVPPTDGGYQGSFPQAAYAERYTDDQGSVIEWDYYSITNTGRYFYGAATPSAGASVYAPPPAELPAVVGWGTNWSYAMSVSYSYITETDSITATADAFGTLVLPQLGSFPALRVNQLTTTREYLSGLLFNTYYTREYYWLVPGFDKAAHIVSQIESAPPAADFTDAYEVRRVFAVQAVNQTPHAVGGLRINLSSGAVRLDWSVATNAASYQVQSAGNLAGTNWQILASPATNFWSESVTPTQRFYRVFAEP